MNHRGEIIEKAVRSCGISVSELAKRLKKSRVYVYNLFEKADIPVEVILQIGKIIHYDFSGEIKGINLGNYNLPDDITHVNDAPDIKYNTSEYWKNKYLETLEKYNRLLSEYLLSVKKNKS